MSDRETPDENGAVSTRPARLKATARVATCASVVAFVLAAFPAAAAAITPYIVGTSAAPASNGATLSATIYPYGFDTTYHFEYGPTISYGTSVPAPDGDAGSAAYPGTFQASQPVTGLTPNTTYHFRLVAQSSQGMATGETGDKIFTTLANPPAVVVNAASPTAEGFNLSGTVNPHGADAKYRFEYGTTMSYGTKVPVPDGDAGSGTTAAPVSQEVKNSALLPNTTYHFRLVAQNSGGSTPSSDQTFTTPPSAPAAPSAVANPPEPIAGGYRLKGAVNPNSLDTTYHFEFGTTTAYGTNLPEPDKDIGEGAGAVAVSQNVTTGLTPNTTYHYRVVAHNSDGTTPSLDQTFTTPPNPPEVVATPFTETAGGFDLNGTINPNGGDTTYHFQFGTTTAYGSDIPASDADAGSGSNAVPVSQLVTGLPPNVPYHYRLVAHNAGGTTMSNDVEFTTPAEASQTPPLTPPPLSPPPSPASRFSIGSVVARGTTAALHVNVPGPGTVSASGKRLKTETASSSGAGTVTLKLKLTGAGLKALKMATGHKLKVKVKITFQPTGGGSSTTSRVVTFKR